MWNRKELKSKARQVVKKSYWTTLVVCFLMALFTGEFGTSIVGIWQSDDSIDPNYIINNENIIMNDTIDEERKQEISERAIFDEKKIKEKLNETQIKIIDGIEANLNSATKSQKYIFKIWDAIKFFDLHLNILGIKLCIAAVISVGFIIFIAEPLTVGGKRYFLKVRTNNGTKIGVLGEVFKKENWINITITMFLKNLYIILWCLTIIGGIIKSYEYRMIPYILAENPKIKNKEAFRLSKHMMKGNKWRTFILDISFLGWNLLSVVTFGLLKILYVNPYNAATNAELYMSLRNNAIKEKYQYYESLNDKKLK